MKPSQGTPFFKISVYYSAAFLQGIAIILIPGASFIFKMPSVNAITDQQYGLQFLPMIVLAVTSTWFFKKILNRLHEERVFYLGTAANLLFLFFLYLMEKAAGNNALSFFLLAFSNGFLGVGFGLSISVLNVLSIELFPRKRDSILAGLHGCLGIGAALSPLLINFFYQQGAWYGSVILNAVLFIALAAVVRVSGAARPVHHLQALHRSQSHGAIPREIGLFMAALFLYGVAESILGNWSMSFLAEKNFSIATASWALSIFWMFITVGRLLATWLVFKIDARFLYRLSPLVVIVSTCAIIWETAEARILFLYVAAGLGCSYFFPLSVSLSTQYFDRWRDQLASLCVAALMTGVGVGSCLTGFLRDAGWITLRGTFAAAAAGMGIAFGIACFLTRVPPSGPGRAE